MDQEFNSLDAQYEACSAYITSQAGLGWVHRDRRYDDGGISGGHMDRPGLQDLVSDIKAGLIDIIVVYKVDRLTRSLTDFARLVDIFDSSDVSFVSVTQAFNTTTSMGRLTLNVLLSFAQFEREVTAERIRDKIAASKKKGMWMGGTVPFGYYNENRKLFMRNDEATIIKSLFQLYIRHRNVRLVKHHADQLGYQTRKRVHKSGKTSGGRFFSRGHIYTILSNPIYRGKIRHKDTIYPGEHEAIIEEGVWEKVQLELKSNAVKRVTENNSRSPALLAGLLFDASGRKLVPHHANKKGRRYRYYVSQRLKSGEEKQGWRIPAHEIEGLVHGILIETLTSGKALVERLHAQNVTASKISTIVASAKTLADQISNADHIGRKALYKKIVRSITLSDDEIAISLNTATVATSSDDFGPIAITHPLSIRRRGHEMKMIVGGKTPTKTNKDHGLIKLIANAYALRSKLEDGSLSSILEFANLHNMDHGDARRLLPLGYLAPDIVEAILSGHQPVDLTKQNLKSGFDLPIHWAEQRVHLGFST
ncbi:MAG: recombinase family protein [Fimbriimonadaceae bacterium]|nr:recombinase family protein [Alphaproteobacteria bacterium]